MQTDNRYTKLFQPLLKGIEQDRRRANATASVTNSYEEAILNARKRISEMQQLSPKTVKNRESEIFYFREIWPRAFGHLFFCQRANDFMSKRALLSADETAALVRFERRETAHFFRSNWEFWKNYQGRTPNINEQFLRAYSLGCIYDPLSMVIDPKNATLASYTAAWGLAYTDYQRLLNYRADGAAAGGDLNEFGWACSDADAVELLYSLHSGGVVLHNGEPADISHLGRWFELNFRKEIVNIYDRFKAVRNRKKDRTPFMHRLLSALERRMNQAEGKGGT